jgi:DNA-binding XRE family transcriptional regulator
MAKKKAGKKSPAKSVAGKNKPPRNSGINRAMIELGLKIVQYREATEITQAKLAELCSVTPVWMNFVENGKREPSTDLIRKIISVLSISAKDLGIDLDYDSLRERWSWKYIQK